MRTSLRAAVSAVAAAGAVVVMVATVNAGVLPPIPIPDLGDVPGLPGGSGPAPDEPPPPTPPPPGVQDGPGAPQVCTGGVLKRGGKLQRFADSLRRGETGCLAGGVYKGGVDLRRPRITLRSFPGRRATISGGQMRISPGADRSALKKLRLVSDELTVLIYASRAVVSENEITNRHTDICVHIDRYPGTPVPKKIRIEGNRIHDCGPLPAANHDHGIYIAVARDTVVRDNLIWGNADRGVQLHPQAFGTRVIDNVIEGNGQGIIFSESSDNNLVKGNIISNSNVRHNVETSASTATNNVVRGNCLWSPLEGYYGGEPPNSGVAPEHPGVTVGPNVIADPRFRNRSEFRPAGNSPCAGFGPSER
jgi:parallel beta-helix repeat protein